MTSFGSYRHTKKSQQFFEVMFRVSCLSVLVLVTVVCGIHRAVAEDELEVQLTQGRLRGHVMVTRKGREIVAFQGIPYAKPPVGALRFQASEPAEGWEGVRDATTDPPECIQTDVYFKKPGYLGSEDCLYINVYTPKVKSAEPLPVMFWIHGGGWIFGSGNTDLYGPNYLLDKDIVLVTFNYRLGPFGFLSTGDEVCPGNNGLKDQVLALKWVRDNVAHFGGDPGQVTLFGESAGGASTHYHLMSPLSRGLFHRAISQSGTTLCPWAVYSADIAKQKAQKLGELLECSTDSSAELVECLRTRDSTAFVDSDAYFREWSIFPLIPFRPVVETGDGGFLLDRPMDLLHDPSKLANVPFMAGVNSGEGAALAAAVMPHPQLLNELDTEFNRLAPLSMAYGETSPDPEYVTQRIREFYFHDQPITNESRYTVIDMYSDAYFTLPVDETVRIQATTNTAPVFYYYFDYKPPASYSAIYGDPDQDYGVAHADELQFLFPHDKLFPEGKFSDDDNKMIDILTTLWTDFARTGNPTPSGHELAHWNPVKTSDVEYLHVGKGADIAMRHTLLAQRTHFWATLPLTDHPYTSVRDEL